jgi:hypothetical protein
MALDTVGQYIDEARILLQDRVEEYRYSNAELINALNLGIMTARRLRPDLFLEATTIPSFTSSDIASSTAFAMDVQYRSPFLFFMVGWAQLRDEEDTQDARSTALISRFTQQLVTLS